jgi:hypothetical protein
MAPEEVPPDGPPFFDPAACWDAARDADDAAPSLMFIIVIAVRMRRVRLGNVLWSMIFMGGAVEK